MSEALLSARRGTGASFSQIAFRVSTILSRPRTTVDQIIRVFQESRQFGWISLQVLSPVHPGSASNPRHRSAPPARS